MLNVDRGVRKALIAARYTARYLPQIHNGGLTLDHCGPREAGHCHPRGNLQLLRPDFTTGEVPTVKTTDAADDRSFKHAIGQDQREGGSRLCAQRGPDLIAVYQPTGHAQRVADEAPAGKQHRTAGKGNTHPEVRALAPGTVMSLKLCDQLGDEVGDQTFLRHSWRDEGQLPIAGVLNDPRSPVEACRLRGPAHKPRQVGPHLGLTPFRYPTVTVDSGGDWRVRDPAA
jgi:hypothetical protein